MSDYIDVGGELIDIKDLKSEKAKEFGFLIISGIFDYVKLIECKTDDVNHIDIVVFEIEVELAQIKVVDIKPIERLACVFFHDDETLPKAFALRDDFPYVPHLNLQEEEYPRCLCLFEENYDDLKISWSNNEMLLRISYWLSKTSMGKLHSIDQPLEPLIPYTTNSLVLPSDYYMSEPNVYQFIERISPNGSKTFIAQNYDPNFKGKCYLDIKFKSKPILHGIIRKLPKTLFELAKILEDADLDLVEVLRENCRALSKIGLLKDQYLYQLMLVIVFPKLRSEGEEVEDYEIRSFILDTTIIELGKSLGIWGEITGMLPALLIPEGSIRERFGEDIKVETLNIHHSYSRKVASHINGSAIISPYNITMIGAGALGSNILCNCLRAGLGKWTVIDDDIYLPHNIGKHVLDSSSIGKNKALELSEYANRILQETEVAVYGLPHNVLKVDYNSAEIKTAFENADIILDVSTSVAVERFIAIDISIDARRVSAFFNPKGTDLVMLIEDKKREIKLDSLEIQYYRCIINTPELENHLKIRTDKVRYASSCRDITSRIPNENIGILSSICSSFLQRVIGEDQAAIHIWHIENNYLEVSHICLQAYCIKNFDMKYGWRIIVDDYVEEKLKQIRGVKLPVETGGILIGSYDMLRRIVYIVDTIPSPPDSKERPVSYIRGCIGLEDEVLRIRSLTEEKLEYIGEWHSHPKGCTGAPSSYDISLLSWITNHLVIDGHPGLMAICSDDGVNYYLETILIN